MSRPRVSLSAASFIQLSAMMNSPERENPVTMRKTVQVSASSDTTWIKVAVEASEARAAYTRTWPTLTTSLGTPHDPNRKPT